jgi:hypothetical protein
VLTAARTKGRKTMNPREHFTKAAKHQIMLAKASIALSGAHRKLAKADEARADLKTSKIHTAIADVHEVLAASHTSHGEHLLEVAKHAPSDWPSAEGNDDATKIAKSFFGKYGDGLFGGYSTPDVTAPASFADLFATR